MGNALFLILASPGLNQKRIDHAGSQRTVSSHESRFMRVLADIDSRFRSSPMDGTRDIDGQ